MELLIEFNDDERPLSESDTTGLVEEINSQELQPGVSAALRERRPGFGELGSLAHIWQVVVDTASSPHTIGAASLAAILRPVFKILEKRQEQSVTLKIKEIGLEFHGPAAMFAGREDELMSLFQKAVSKKRPAKKKTGA